MNARLAVGLRSLSDRVREVSVSPLPPEPISWVTKLTYVTYFLPLFLAWLFVVVPMRVIEDSIFNLSADDAFFYLVLARNAVEGKWSSFDGVDPTNGYHPLWGALTTGLAFVFRTPNGLLRAALVTCSLLYLAGLVAMTRTVAKRFGHHAALASAAVYVLLVCRQSWYLLEIPLASAALMFFLRAVVRWVEEPPRKHGALAAGLLGGVFVLARLDAVFIVGPVLALGCHYARRNGSRYWPAPIALGAVVSPYLAANVLLYGHLMPISGALKSTFPHPQGIQDLFATYTYFHSSGMLHFIAADVVIFAVFFASTFRKRATRAQEPFLHVAAAASLGSLCFLTYEVLFARSPFLPRGWHFGTMRSLSAMLVGVTFANFVRWNAPKTLVAAAMLFTSVLKGNSAFTVLVGRQMPRSSIFDTAEWIAKNVPVGERIAATDPGIVSYFGHRKTTNLDGLINNFDFQRRLREHSLSNYLDEKNITYVFVHSAYLNQNHYDPSALSSRIFFPAHLYPGEGDAIQFDTRDRVYASSDDGFVAWKR